MAEARVPWQARSGWQTLWALVYLAVWVGLPTAAALGRVYVRQDCLALGYELSVEQQKREGLRAQVRKAELTRARGRTPAALVAMADRLQLQPPRPSQTLGARAGVKSIAAHKLEADSRRAPKRRAAAKTAAPAPSTGTAQSTRAPAGAPPAPAVPPRGGSPQAPDAQSLRSSKRPGGGNVLAPAGSAAPEAR